MGALLTLPEDLRLALESELGRVPSRELTRAVNDLSRRYRSGHGIGETRFVRSALEVMAYCAYRLPATFAAVHAVFDELRRRRPDLGPESVLDVGGGVGAAAWAAADVWPNVERITVLELDPEMIRVGKALASGSAVDAIRGIAWREADVTLGWKEDSADLVVAAYLLGELAPDDRLQSVERLWAYTLDSLVIVEPGTPGGYRLVRQAEEVLHREGATIVAPFPHGWRCVESTDDWCHFSQRIPRSRLHRTVKRADLAHEDEKYSYVAASRHPGSPIAARVIRHPQVRPGHVRLVVCSRAGVTHIVVPRSDREAFRRAKHLRWGSAIPVEDAPLYGLSV